MIKLNAKPSARATLSGVRRRTLGTAIAFALVAGAASNAQAFEFSSGDWNGTIDTLVSYGISVRVEDRDNDLIGLANINPLIGQQPLAAQLVAPGRFSVNSDDGNLNYDKGDPFSNAVKATTEFSLNYRENSGAFLRASYFYDFENADRGNLTSAAKEKVGTDLKLLDAFVFHNFQLGGKDGNVRLGRQVHSWGESTFIQGGINTINPIDVSKLRVAGSELKEAFLGVDSLSSSFNFTENLSGELVYLFEFEQTEPDPQGTYFGTNDFGTLGSEFVMLNFGRTDEPASFLACQRGLVTSATPLAFASCSAAVPRAPDRKTSDSGQYGAALRYFSPTLNDTEFGLFFMNYHSRLPLASGIAVTPASPSFYGPAVTGRYFIEYPEDIRMYGFSFNTTLNAWGVALQGELSYRDNQPYQIDDVELLFAALSPLNALTPSTGLHFRSQLGTYAPGQEIRGWERHKVSQFQTTATKVFGPGNWLAAEQIAAVIEVGGTEVWDLPNADQLRYQCDGSDTGGGFDSLTGSLRNPIRQTTGFCTPFSWGYRVAVRADYNNVWGTPFNMSPRIAFNHDVNGISPGPGGNFIEGRKSATFGVEANYLNRWAADLSYSIFTGAGDLNLISDRDFVSFTVKYSF
jgi:hypothetical protein